MFFKRIIIILVILLIPTSIYAYRTSRPVKFTDLTKPDQITQLNDIITELWNITNGRYNLNITTTDPNGNTKGDVGDMVLYNNSSSFSVKVNTDGEKTWISSGGGGSKNLTITTVTTNYTILSTDDLIRSVGNITLTLPPATGSGKVYYIKHIDHGDVGTLVFQTTGSDTIDGVASVTIPQTSEDCFVVCDAIIGRWDIIGKYWYVELS